MKYFVPKDEPEVTLLMSAVDGQLSATASRGDDDDEMCVNGLLDDDDDDDQQQLSLLIDKSALADDTSIVGMSHDIDDVVDSVINHDDLPPLADLSDLAVLPLKPAAEASFCSVESQLLPKLSSSSTNVPGLTYVNSEPAVLVSLRRLGFHRYGSRDVKQRVSVPMNCVKSFSVTPVVSDTADSKPTMVMSLSSNRTSSTGHISVKQEPNVTTSKQLQNVPKLKNKSVLVKDMSSGGAQKSVIARVSAGGLLDGSAQSSVVDCVIATTTATTAVATAASDRVLCNKVQTRPTACISQLSTSSLSAKRKSDSTLRDSCSTKKRQCTDNSHKSG